MRAVLILGLLGLVMLLPLRVGIQATHADGTEGALTLRMGPVRLSFPFRTHQSAQGAHQLMMLPRHPQEKAHPPSPAGMRKGMVLLGTLLRTDKARRFLLGHLRLHDLSVQIHLSLSDAASTACVTGLLRALTAFVPVRVRRKAHVSLQPDFLATRSRWTIHCMVSWPLGILLITGGMTLAAWLMERQEHRPAGKEVS
ncbi:MAG: DUF2953 domain-containing protein [Aristaeellaceae bacterium]